MGTTFTPIQGYLAGIYRSPGVTVDGATLHELMTNGTFEAAAATGWQTTGSAAGSTVTVARGYGRGGYSYGAHMHEGTTGAVEIHQTTGLDTPLTTTLAAKYQFVASCWALFSDTGCTGTLALKLRNPTGTVLASGQVDMISGHPYYGNATGSNWGYFSVAVTPLARTKYAEVYVRRNMGVTGWLKVDDISCVLIEQVAGAYGTLSLGGDEWQTEDITTFASCGTDGPFRRFAPTMRAPTTVNVESYYVADESVATEMAAGTNVFVKLITQKGTVTADRMEFWALPVGINWSSPPGEIQKEGFTLQVDGVIGVADR